jgi:hypothetical protein
MTETPDKKIALIKANATKTQEDSKLKQRKTLNNTTQRDEKQTERKREL